MHSFVNAIQHLRGVLPATHEYNAFHAIALVIDSEDPGLRGSADLDASHVAHKDRNSLDFGDQNALNIRNRLHQPDATDHHSLLAIIQQCATGVLVIGVHSLGDLANRKVVFVQSERIDLDLVLLDQTAKRSDVSNAGHLKE